MSVRVYPGAKNPSHEISLSDGVHKWGLRLDGGAQAIQEVPMTASTLQFSGGGTKFGDWEPGMSHIEQRTWEGGRGQEEYVDDPTKFFDSMNAWTINRGKIFPAPQWNFATGLRQSYEHLPGSVKWQPLIGSKRFISTSFTVGDSIFTACQVYIWLRRVGSPGNVTVAIYSDNNNQPDTLIEGAFDTLGIESVRDVISRWIGFDVSACDSLSANTKYHIVVSGAVIDGAANHWEIGIDTMGGSSLASADGTTWSDSGCTLYHRVVDPAVTRKWHMFLYKGGLYAIDQRTDGSASKLYLNGERGTATGGSSTTLIDINKNWNDNEWQDAWVGIAGGCGYGQRARITSNSSTTLTVEQWDISPDETSEYVIFNTPKWLDISPISGDLIDGVVEDIAVLGDEVQFAQGLSTNILRMRWNPNATPPTHEFADDGTNTANLLFAHVDTQNGLQIWRAKSSDALISNAPLSSWGTPHIYESEISVGFNSEQIINLYEHDGNFYAFKTDGRYWIKSDGTIEKSVGDIGFIPSINNGQALLSHGLYTYFSWGGYSLQRLYDSGYNYDLSNIGPDADGGLPDDRRGRISALLGHSNGIIAAVDGGKEKYSSVLMMPQDNFGWHEVFRSWEVGARINNLFWQDIGNSKPRLWVSVGGELVYQEWPEGTFNPLKDSGMSYCHEATLITSSIDMGAARLPKFLKEFSVLSDNLAAGIEIHLDYQTDENVGTDNWIWAGTFYTHPEDVVPIQQGNLRKIRLRLRLMTDNCAVPPVIQATVLEGFARTPLKYQWNMRVKVGDTQRDLSGTGLDHDPDAFLSWLKESATKAKSVHMRSIWEQMDNKYVIVEPPTLLRSFTNNLLGFWGGSVNITVRES